jgi:hypothetical protein
MNDIKVNDYLTWEYSQDLDIQYLNCPAPTPMRNHLPQWFKDLKAWKPTVDIANNQTIRNCLGFRGISQIGYTIPLPEELTLYDTYFNRGRLHPDMIHGTKWANKEDGRRWAPGDTSPYEYGIRLLHWPWRAKMARGWRLLLLPYLLDWSNDWNEFAGTVEPNYHIVDGTGIGSGLKWTQPVDTQYNYYNIETVIAIHRAKTIPQGTVTFCAVPYFDPELLEQQDNI